MDLRNYDLLIEKTKEFDIEGIIHFAAYKSVGESVFEPLKYYDNNLNLFNFMVARGKDCQN